MAQTDDKTGEKLVKSTIFINNERPGRPPKYGEPMRDEDRLNLRLPLTIKNRLRELARRTGRDMIDHIRTAIEDHLDFFEQK